MARCQVSYPRSVGGRRWLRSRAPVILPNEKSQIRIGTAERADGCWSIRVGNCMPQHNRVKSFRAISSIICRPVTIPVHLRPAANFAYSSALAKAPSNSWDLVVMIFLEARMADECLRLWQNRFNPHDRMILLLWYRLGC